MAGDRSEGASFFLVFLFVSIERVCDGLALHVTILHSPHLLNLIPFVLIRSANMFYRINQEKSDSSDPETAKQERVQDRFDGSPGLDKNHVGRFIVHASRIGVVRCPSQEREGSVSLVMIFWFQCYRLDCVRPRRPLTTCAILGNRAIEMRLMMSRIYVQVSA